MNAREYEIMYQIEDKHWWYVGMHRLIFATLARLYDVKERSPRLILDASCGTGVIAQRLRQFGQVRAIDLSNLALQFSKRRGLNGHLSQASVMALPVPANTFDLVVSLDVLCSVAEDQQALVMQQGFEIEKISFANSLLFPIIAPYRLATNWLPKSNKGPRSDVFLLPWLVNDILSKVMKLESLFISQVDLPIGMSLFAVARKGGTRLAVEY